MAGNAKPTSLIASRTCVEVGCCYNTDPLFNKNTQRFHPGPQVFALVKTSISRLLLSRSVLAQASRLAALALVCIGLSGPIAARVMPDLYRVTVNIDSQSPSELKRASREALAELFVRISGQQAVLNQDAIVAAIRDAGRYTKQFSYQRQASAEGEPQLQVALEFESSLVEDTLRRAGLPLWSSNRPSVLVWLAVEDAQGRRFVGAEQDPGLIDALRDNARRRGLALQLPLLDLQDLVALSADDIWRQNSARIDDASERYKPDTILVGRVTQLNNGRWLGRWSYHLGGRRVPFDGETNSGESFIASGLDQVAETLAAEYAIIPVQVAEGGLIMRLTDVRNFVDYARAIQYLEGIVAVHHANVVSLERDELILRLIADGEIAQLKQVFALDRQLQAVTEPGYTGPYPIALNYRWPSEAPPLPPEPEPAAVTAPTDPEAVDAGLESRIEEIN